MTNLTENQKQVLNAIQQNGKTTINVNRKTSIAVNELCDKFNLNNRSFKRTVNSLIKKGLLIETKETEYTWDGNNRNKLHFTFVEIKQDGKQYEIEKVIYKNRFTGCVRVEIVQTEEVQAEEVQAEEVQAEEVQAEEVQAEEVQAEEVQAEEVQAEEVQAEEVQAEEAQAEEVQAEEAQAEEVQAEEVQAEEVPALTADQLETLTSISKNHHYCCSWRIFANIMTWMEDLADLGFISILCDIEKCAFKLEITQAGIDALKQETITDHEDIDFKSEFSCNDPSFDFNEYLVQTAENYDRPLTKKALENIFAEIENHHKSEFGDYDRIEYALCTESNEYPAGINIDNRYGEFYVLDFADTDVVLHLVK